MSCMEQHFESTKLQQKMRNHGCYGNNLKTMSVTPKFYFIKSYLLVWVIIGQFLKYSVDPKFFVRNKHVFSIWKILDLQNCFLNCPNDCSY
jgi:hypothetical protein